MERKRKREASDDAYRVESTGDRDDVTSAKWVIGGSFPSIPVLEKDFAYHQITPLPTLEQDEDALLEYLKAVSAITLPYWCI